MEENFFARRELIFRLGIFSLIGMGAMGLISPVYAVETLLSADGIVELTGTGSGDDAGVSVASAGDVNNDGYEDILVGADLNDDGGTDAGSVYLVYGSSEGVTADSLSEAVEFTGEAPGDDAGFAVSGAGDINGDGFDDMLVGAPGSDAGGTDSGTVYVIYGQEAELISGSLSAEVVLGGELAGDAAGTSVSAAGDLNGDGYDDVLIGAPETDSSGVDAGSVYVVYGSETELTSTNLSTEVELSGEAAGDAAGYAVDTAGDLNADGYDDVLIGADATDTAGVDAGSVYVVYGQSTELISDTLDEVTELTGEAAGDLAGDAVAGVGDLNGDGFDDIVIGAEGNDDDGVDAGAVYVLYGQANELVDQSLGELTELVGEAAGDLAGFAIAAAGDVNTDSYDDFLVSAIHNDDDGDESGAVYVVYGHADELISGNLQSDIELEGEAEGDLAGEDVAAGDVNGDGVSELLIGAPGNDDNMIDTGAVYIVSPDALPIELEEVTKDGNRLHLTYTNGSAQVLRPFKTSSNFRHALSTDGKRLVVYNSKRVKLYESGEAMDQIRVWRKTTKRRKHFQMQVAQLYSGKSYDTVLFASTKSGTARVGVVRLTANNTLVKKHVKTTSIKQGIPVVLTASPNGHRFTASFGAGDKQINTTWKVTRRGLLRAV